MPVNYETWMAIDFISNYLQQWDLFLILLDNAPAFLI